MVLMSWLTFWILPGVDLPLKKWSRDYLGFGPNTLDIFYGPLHPPQMPEML
jgi:hypothetical protein